MRVSMRDWRFLALAVIAFLFARLTGGRLPFYMFYLSAALWIFAYIWTRHTLRRAECVIQVERDRVEVGQRISIKVRLDNDTPLPIPWVEIDDATSQRLVEVDAPHQATVIPLLGSRILYFTLTARRRGHYPVGPIRVSLGDPFGLFRGVREFHSKALITVYPRVQHIEGLLFPLAQPFGPVRTRERAFEDPSNQAEIRPYRAGDNPRHIHWKTSARMGELMLREYELNATTPVFLFPDLSANAGEALRTAEGFAQGESLIEITASLAALGLRRKLDVSLVCHAQERFAVSPGRSTRTFHEVMEVLCRAEPEGRLAIEQVVELEAAHLSGKATLVIITPLLSAALSDLLIRMRAKHQVMLVLLQQGHLDAAADAESASPSPSLTHLLAAHRIAVYLVSAQDDIRRLADLRLTTEGVKGWPPSAHLSPIRL